MSSLSFIGLSIAITQIIIIIYRLELKYNTGINE